MLTLKPELTDVIYNAATQAFEAKVTLHEPTGPVSYACEVEAPITTSFEDAAELLTREALRRHGAPLGLRSIRKRAPLRQTLWVLPRKLRRGLPLGQYGFFRGRAA